jgi:hypothetical protein
MDSDTKLTTLDNEVKIVKGEVKALLIDIREIMNNMENPFYNIRSMADGPDTPPDTRMRGEGAPMGGISPESMLEQKPYPDFAGMSAPEEGVPQTGAGHTPNVMGQAETPGHAPDFADMFGQYEEAKQSGGNGAGKVESPGHAPDFAEMPAQQVDAVPTPNVAGQVESPGHAPDFAEMFRQYEEAKQSGGNGAGQVEAPEHAPDFTGIPELVPDFAEVRVPHEVAKQSEGMLEEIPGIQPDIVFDIHTLAELMRWTDYTLATIERSKLDMLLDLCVLTGHIPETLKDIISKITDLSTQEIAEGSASTMQDHISAMFQLNAILSPGESDQKAIYSIYGELPWRKVG